MSHRLLPFSPERYHGKRSSRPYFEGWYFKQASPSGAFAVIPGLFRGTDAHEDTAFIQVIMGQPPRSWFVPFPAELFSCHPRRFEMHIGENYFSMNEVNLNIPEIGLGAKLKYDGHITLRRSPLCPSVMGPFAYLPGMQCNHGVLSLWHSTCGEVYCEGKRLVFDNADGYIEKDWGEAFPESWIWMQCGDANAALMCAVASIPLGRVAFTGLICVLWANGRQYRFATYNGGRVLGINQSDGVLTVELGRGGYRLCIIARNTQFGSLKAPTRQGMTREIQESVSATFDVSLCKGTHSLYTGRFKNGGLEMLNAPALLERKQKKSPR